MKILVINPVGHSKWDESDKEFLSSYAHPKTRIDVKSLPRGPKSVESIKDYVEVIPLVIDQALKLHKEYNALIVNCFLDPAVDYLKLLLRKPVIGPCEASLLLAKVIGRRFAIITVGKGDVIKLIERRINFLGFKDFVVKIDGIPLGVLDIDVDKGRTLREILRVGNEVIKTYQADVIILGCTGLAGFSFKAQEELGVPVIDPALAALKVAEAVLTLGVHE